MISAIPLRVRPGQPVYPQVALLLALFCTCSISPPGAAQTAERLSPITKAIAITGADIVAAPGQRIESGTILIRDGLIEAVGVGVPVPADARIIEGDSLTVYAGFIDGLSHTGVVTPKRVAPGSRQESNNDDEKINRANPPNDVAGLQPDRSAFGLIEAGHASIDSLRRVGFTVAHVAPEGGMLPGMGSVILLGGDEAADMVLERDVSMFAQIEGGPRVYPATPMGVMATMRQLYREAGRRKQLQAAYSSSAAGAARPEYDPLHYAFFPVLDGERPVFMHTDDALDIYRALRLKNQLGYPLVLTGLNEGFEYIDLLLDAEIPLFLTLKTPDDPSKDKKALEDSTETAEPASYDPSLHVTDHTDTRLERINLQARRTIFYRQYLSTAASFHEAGIRFGFSTKGVKPADIHKNLRAFIENGLPEDVALAALTTNAARALGVSPRLGTIEPGKIANLVVTTGPLFDEDTHIKHVLVAGRIHTYEPPPAKDGTEQPTEQGARAF